MLYALLTFSNFKMWIKCYTKIDDWLNIFKFNIVNAVMISAFIMPTKWDFFDIFLYWTLLTSYQPMTFV